MYLCFSIWSCLLFFLFKLLSLLVSPFKRHFIHALTLSGLSLASFAAFPLYVGSAPRPLLARSLIPLLVTLFFISFSGDADWQMIWEEDIRWEKVNFSFWPHSNSTSSSSFILKLLTFLWKVLLSTWVTLCMLLSLSVSLFLKSKCSKSTYWLSRVFRFFYFEHKQRYCVFNSRGTAPAVHAWVQFQYSSASEDTSKIVLQNNQWCLSDLVYRFIAASTNTTTNKAPLFFMEVKSTSPIYIPLNTFIDFLISQTSSPCWLLWGAPVASRRSPPKQQ